MPRKGPAPKRPLDVDPVYGSQVVTQLVSKVLQDGKKQVAQRIVYTALEGCREKTGTDPVVTLKRGVDDALGGLLLAVHEDLADQLGDQRRPVDRVDVDGTLRGRALTRHYFFSFLAP